MMKRALLLLLLTAAWAFGSWWYYTCKIKGFCRADGNVASVTDTAVNTATTAAVTGVITTDSDDQTKLTATTDFVDEDGDAISDEDERALGTDPSNDDSDGDGIKDNEELGVDLQSPIDTDNDDIINALDDDDDNDGIPSKLETQLGSNPLSDDSDGDGISDTEELGTDKENPADSDGDGIVDLIDSIDDRAEQSQASDDHPADQETQNNDTAQDQNTEQESPVEETPEAPTKDSTNQQVDEKTAANDKVTVDTGNAQQNTSPDTEIPVQKSRLYFPFRSSNPGLSEAATQYFEGVVTWLQQHKSNTVVLTGHTDNVGKAKNNLDLGLKRAIEIKDLLTKMGADSAQIDVASMGETQPIASNDTDDGRRKNRRVELIPVIK